MQSNLKGNLFGGHNGNSGGNQNSGGGCRQGYEIVTETTYETINQQQCSTEYETVCDDAGGGGSNIPSYGRRKRQSYGAPSPTSGYSAPSGGSSFSSSSSGYSAPSSGSRPSSGYSAPSSGSSSLSAYSAPSGGSSLSCSQIPRQNCQSVPTQVPRTQQRRRQRIICEVAGSGGGGRPSYNG